MRLYFYLIAHRLALVVTTPLSQISDTNDPKFNIYNQLWSQASTEEVAGTVVDQLSNNAYPYTSNSQDISSTQPPAFDLAKTLSKPAKVGICCTTAWNNDDEKTCLLCKSLILINPVTRSFFWRMKM